MDNQKGFTQVPFLGSYHFCYLSSSIFVTLTKKSTYSVKKYLIYDILRDTK